MEKRGQHTQEQGHAYYRLIEGNLPEIGEPIVMDRGVEYTLRQKVVDRIKQYVPRRESK